MWGQQYCGFCIFSDWMKNSRWWMALPSSAGAFQFVFCLLWGGRHGGLCWHSGARAALFSPPLVRLAGFPAGRRGQGPAAAAALALAGWPAASARALCHRPGGSRGHRECRTGTGGALLWPPLVSAGSEPLNCEPGKPTCAALRASKEPCK